MQMIGLEADNDGGVRPVVSLKSGVTNEQCPKIPDITEVLWDLPKQFIKYLIITIDKTGIKIYYSYKE